MATQQERTTSAASAMTALFDFVFGAIGVPARGLLVTIGHAQVTSALILGIAVAGSAFLFDFSQAPLLEERLRTQEIATRTAALNERYTLLKTIETEARILDQYPGTEIPPMEQPE